MYIPAVVSDDIVAAITRMEMAEGDVAAIMIGEQQPPDITRLVAQLNERGIPFFGGIFPGIIYDDRRYEKGAVITHLPALAPPFLVKGLNGEQMEVPDFQEERLLDAETQYTAMILVDGLTANIALFLEKMFNRFGDAVHYFGGGAGSLSLQQAPCLFCPEGFVQDAAIIVFLKLESQLGVRHGWENVMGPFVATRTAKNVIMELNWKNAFQVYAETVEADSGKRLTRDNFFDIAKGYPFGILKEGTEDIVRDPLTVNEKGELICVGEVPENSALRILKGRNASLIGAAGQAAEDSLGADWRVIHKTLIADCISRVIFLEEDFAQELKAVKNAVSSVDSTQTPMGILTLGEIASYGENFLEFFNKTIVIGTFYAG